jgi:hypothetical protein
VVHDPSQTPNPFYQPVTRSAVWPVIIGALIAFAALCVLLVAGIALSGDEPEPAPTSIPTTYGYPPN